MSFLKRRLWVSYRREIEERDRRKRQKEEIEGRNRR